MRKALIETGAVDAIVAVGPSSVPDGRAAQLTLWSLDEA